MLSGLLVMAASESDAVRFETRLEAVFRSHREYMPLKPAKMNSLKELRARIGVRSGEG